MCTSAPEAVLWKITGVLESLVKPDAPTSVLPGSVRVLCVQPAVEVAGLVGHECLVDHDCSLIHHKLLDSKPSTSVQS